MPHCKLCGREDDAAKPGAIFSCGRCIDDGILIRTADKVDLERLFAEAAFVNDVWDEGNARAKFLMEQCRVNLDRSLCIRMRAQVSNLKLRRRYIEALYEGGNLPRVSRAVKWHFECEFKQSYPNGVSDVETHHT